MIKKFNIKIWTIFFSTILLVCCLTERTLKLSYNSLDAKYFLGKSIKVNTAMVSPSGLSGLKFSIDPALPSGLNLNTSTGEIYGTPKAVTPRRNYEVTVTTTLFVAKASTTLIIEVGDKYIDNKDGTITDSSNRVWEKCINGQNWNKISNSCGGSEKKLVWQAAMDYCKSLELASKGSWHLPNKVELEYFSIFPKNKVDSFFWSSSNKNTPKGKPWSVKFKNGYSYSQSSSSGPFFVRCVSGP